MSAYTDAQDNNNITRNVKQYRDLDLFFSRKSNKDVNKVTDIEAVKRSVRNLVLLNSYEKPFHPEIAGDVRALLFENMTPLTSSVIARKIQDVIENFEPRARLVGVNTTPDFDRNAYEVTVYFYVVNAPTELVEVNQLLEVTIMAINEKRLSVTQFDFDDVKDNLKTFLKNQTQFTDYDFEGSGMSALLDVLAYNTHYLGFNANMLANEMFLDSASLRSSVVSHAKMLGYEVASPRVPKATINVSLSTSNSTATMPVGTAFTTSVDGVSYQFVTISDVTRQNTGIINSF